MMEIYENMFNSTVRIAGIWPIPNGDVPERLLDAIDHWDLEALPEPIQQLCKHWDESERDSLVSGYYGGRDGWDELNCSAFNQKIFGWLGLAESPIFTATSKNSGSFSWGHYQTKLIWAERADDILKLACDWAEKEQADVYAKFVEAA